MTDDRPRALLRSLINDAAILIDQMQARGYGEDEIATVCRVYAEARLGPRRVAPIRTGPEWGWKDGCWMPLEGHETGPETELT